MIYPATLVCLIASLGTGLLVSIRFLITYSIVVRRGGMSDSSIPHGLMNGPWSASDLPNGHLRDTKSSIITIGKVYQEAEALAVKCFLDYHRMNSKKKHAQELRIPSDRFFRPIR